MLAQAPPWQPPQEKPWPQQPHPGAPAPAKKTTSGCTPLLIAIIIVCAIGTGLVILAAIVRGVAGSPASQVASPSRTEPSTVSSPFAKGQVKCSAPLFGSVNCTFESSGVGSAKACWDVVIECSLYTHRLHGCSALVPSGATESYSFSGISPPIHEGEECTAERVENIVFQ